MARNPRNKQRSTCELEESGSESDMEAFEAGADMDWKVKEDTAGTWAWLGNCLYSNSGLRTLFCLISCVLSLCRPLRRCGR